MRYKWFSQASTSKTIRDKNWILLYFYRRKYDNLNLSLMSILLTREMKKFVPFLDFFWYFLFYWVKNHESAAGFSFLEWFSFSENEQIPFLDFPEFSKSGIALLKIFLVTPAYQNLECSHSNILVCLLLRVGNWYAFSACSNKGLFNSILTSYFNIK